jgi:hypothetical protein
VAAQLANLLLQTINEIHQHLQIANNTQILQKLRDELAVKQKELSSIEQSAMSFKSSNRLYNINEQALNKSSIDTSNGKQESLSDIAGNLYVLSTQVKEYQRLIAQYELAVKISPQPLLVVESARPSLWPDKPDVVQTTIFAFFASLLFSFLLALFVESRNKAL